MVEDGFLKFRSWILSLDIYWSENLNVLFEPKKGVKESSCNAAVPQLRPVMSLQFEHCSLSKLDTLLLVKSTFSFTIICLWSCLGPEKHDKNTYMVHMEALSQIINFKKGVFSFQQQIKMDLYIFYAQRQKKIKYLNRKRYFLKFR